MLISTYIFMSFLMHIMRIFWFTFCCGFVYLLFLTLLLSVMLWLQNMSTECLALKPRHCREKPRHCRAAQDSPLKKSGAEGKPCAASRWGHRTRMYRSNMNWTMKNSGYWTTLNLEDKWHLRDAVRVFWGWLRFLKTFEDSKYESGRMNAGKRAKITAINGTQPSPGQSSGSIAFRCRFVFV